MAAFCTVFSLSDFYCGGVLVVVVGGVFDLCHLDDDVHLIFANTKFFGP
jgi:hypothetical protein